MEKHKIQKAVFTYTQRKNFYKKALRNCSKQLIKLRRKLKVYNKEDRYIKLTKKFNKFFGENVLTTKDVEMQEYYIKFCLENDVKIGLIKEKLKLGYKTIHKRRKNLTLQLNTNPNKKQLWQDLKEYMKIYQK